MVRVYPDSGRAFYGRSRGTRGDSLRVSAPHPVNERAVALARVDSLWVQRGTEAQNIGLGGARPVSRSGPRSAR